MRLPGKVKTRCDDSQMVTISSNGRFRRKVLIKEEIVINVQSSIVMVKLQCFSRSGISTEKKERDRDIES